MVVVEKIKSHPDLITISKNFHFIIRTLKNQQLNPKKTLICFLNFLFMKN